MKCVNEDGSFYLTGHKIKLGLGNNHSISAYDLETGELLDSSTNTLVSSLHRVCEHVQGKEGLNLAKMVLLSHLYQVSSSHRDIWDSAELDKFLNHIIFVLLNEDTEGVSSYDNLKDCVTIEPPMQIDDTCDVVCINGENGGVIGTVIFNADIGKLSFQIAGQDNCFTLNSPHLEGLRMHIVMRIAGFLILASKMYFDDDCVPYYQGTEFESPVSTCPSCTFDVDLMSFYNMFLATYSI